jgi:hypothetical protein
MSLAKRRAIPAQYFGQTIDSDSECQTSHDVSQNRHSKNLSTFKKDISQNVKPENRGIWTTQLSSGSGEGELSLLKSRGTDYRVLQKLLQPGMTFGIQMVESDDHAFNSDECNLENCKYHKLDQNGNEHGGGRPEVEKYSMENPPKLSAEKRRDHLHLLRRRKSRARFLKQEEQVNKSPNFYLSGSVTILGVKIS